MRLTTSAYILAAIIGFTVGVLLGPLAVLPK